MCYLGVLLQSLPGDIVEYKCGDGGEDDVGAHHVAGHPDVQTAKRAPDNVLLFS